MIKHQSFSKDSLLKSIHGPCLSDVTGERIDIAFCLHCRKWVTCAKRWIARPRNHWPSNELISRIVAHGVLVIQIGIKGSKYEEIEWRISFSIAENFFSLNHTQLLVYALMKILLKDIICQNKNLSDLLRSYFLKTVLFWVSEELPQSEWIPSKMISLFMQCFKRLIYFIKILYLPHYFIPENNLIESKILERDREYLLDELNHLYDQGWTCLFQSPKLAKFKMAVPVQLSNDNGISNLNHFLNSNLLDVVFDGRTFLSTCILCSCAKFDLDILKI